MAKIIAPNNQYTGVSATVPFAKGVGQTDDPKLIQWFKDHGYMVEETKAAAKDSEKLEEQKEEVAVDGESSKTNSKTAAKTKAAAKDSK